MYKAAKAVCRGAGCLWICTAILTLLRVAETGKAPNLWPALALALGGVGLIILGEWIRRMGRAAEAPKQEP